MMQNYPDSKPLHIKRIELSPYPDSYKTYIDHMRQVSPPIDALLKNNQINLIIEVSKRQHLDAAKAMGADGYTNAAILDDKSNNLHLLGAESLGRTVEEVGPSGKFCIFVTVADDLTPGLFIGALTHELLVHAVKYDAEIHAAAMAYIRDPDKHLEFGRGWSSMTKRGGGGYLDEDSHHRQMLDQGQGLGHEYHQAILALWKYYLKESNNTEDNDLWTTYNSIASALESQYLETLKKFDGSITFGRNLSILSRKQLETKSTGSHTGVLGTSHKKRTYVPSTLHQPKRRRTSGPSKSISDAIDNLIKDCIEKCSTLSQWEQKKSDTAKSVLDKPLLHVTQSVAQGQLSIGILFESLFKWQQQLREHHINYNLIQPFLKAHSNWLKSYARSQQGAQMAAWHKAWQHAEQDVTSKWMDGEDIDGCLKTYIQNGTADVIASSLTNVSGGQFLPAALAVNYDKRLDAAEASGTTPARFVICPINFNNIHWVTLVIEHDPSDPFHTRAYFFDPKGSSQEKRKIIQQVLSDSTIYASTELVDLTPPGQVLQRDGHTCGSWMVKAAQTIVAGRLASKRSESIMSDLSLLNHRGQLNQFHDKFIERRNERAPDEKALEAKGYRPNSSDSGTMEQEVDEKWQTNWPGPS